MLMTGDEWNEDEQNCSGREEIESPIRCVTRLGALIMTGIECLES